MAHLIGETRPCFGEYKCPNCKRIWESSKAWRHYGQKCKHCCINVQATKLQLLFHYLCESCFKQTKGVEGHWTYKLLQQGKACLTCGKNVKPCLTFSDFVRARKLWSMEEGCTQGSRIDPNLSHLQDLCEKCTRLGYSCTKSLANGNAANAYISTDILKPWKPEVRYEFRETFPKTFSFQVVEENYDLFVPAPKAIFISNSSGITNGLSYREVAIKAIATQAIRTENSNAIGNGNSNEPTIPKSDQFPWPVTYCSKAATGIKSDDTVMIDVEATKSSSKVVPIVTDIKYVPIGTSEPSKVKYSDIASKSDSNQKGNFGTEFPPLVDTQLVSVDNARKRLKSPKMENIMMTTFSSGKMGNGDSSEETSLRSKYGTSVRNTQRKMEYVDDLKRNQSNCNDKPNAGHYEDRSGSRPEDEHSNSSRGMLVFIGVGVAAAAAFFLYRHWGK